MWVIEFNVNKDYISKNLCVNRAKPELKCGGKCQLMKKLAEEEDNESRNQSAAKTQMNEVLFEDSFSTFEIASVWNETVVKHPPYLLPEYITPSFSFFHPPSLI